MKKSILAFGLLFFSGASFANIDGNWKTGCVKNAIYFNQIGLNIQGNDVTIQQLWFKDESCSQSSDNGQDVTLDAKISVKKVSDNKYDADISLKGGGKIYEIFELDGETLYIGDRTTGDASSPQKRPTSTRKDWPMTKAYYNLEY